MIRNIFFHENNSRRNTTLPSSYPFYQVLQTSFSLTNDITFPHHQLPHLPVIMPYNAPNYPVTLS